jgi:septum formation protein
MVVPTLYLASASPRRRELLAQIGVQCRVVPVDLDESPAPGEPPDAYVRRLALDKARAALILLGKVDGPLILAADTVVVAGTQVLGKPRDVGDAAAMIRRLAGREHRVLSGVALIGPGPQERSAVSESRVRMRPIDEEEIAAYWATGEPIDKAGGYAIQGRAAVFVEALAGSYSGVMGLPLFETAALLAAAGLDPLQTISI